MKNWRECYGPTRSKKLPEVTCVTPFGGFGKSCPQSREPDYLLADDLSITFNAASDYWLDVDQVEKLE